MKIDAFITCVGENSLKFLEFTLPFNQNLFDNFYVVTAENDTPVQEFCKKNNYNFLVTDSFFKNGSKFNKGAGINYGIEIVAPKDWILHLDSDVLLPDDFLKFKNNEIEPPADLFFGCRRVIIPTYSDFVKLVGGEKNEEDFECPYGIGYGFFQLWNVNGAVVKSAATYPESYDSADSDWQWRNLWGETINQDKEYTRNLKEIPDFKCFHLGETNIEKSVSFWDNQEKLN